ncbi:MAG TPA: GNAT family N-acetyltransferase [Mycobacteriales bacterium]|nr:GNAT family N-acetyltransferase [Mycobacteriales bacterium]
MHNSHIHLDIARQRAEALRNEVHALRLPSEHRITIRPLTLRDREIVTEVFAGLGLESRIRRFHGPKKRLSRAEIRYLTEIDHHDHEALAALTREGRGLGVARFVRLHSRPDAAEVAIAVVDDWHGRGVGTALMQLLGRRARAVGVTHFTAAVTTENTAVPRLLKTINAEVVHQSRRGTVVQYEIVIPPDDASADGLVACGVGGGPATG